MSATSLLGLKAEEMTTYIGSLVEHTVALPKALLHHLSTIECDHSQLGWSLGTVGAAASATLFFGRKIKINAEDRADMRDLIYSLFAITFSLALNAHVQKPKSESASDLIPMALQVVAGANAIYRLAKLTCLNGVNTKEKFARVVTASCSALFLGQAQNLMQMVHQKC